MIRQTLAAFALFAAAAAAAQDGDAAMIDDVMAAIRADDAAALTALLDADPGLAGARDANGLSALSLSAYMGRDALVDLVRARRGTPDFFEAVILGDAEAVRDALVAGQDVDAFAPDGFTALGLAAFFRHPGIAAALIEAGADVNLQARNAQGVGAIHAATARADVATLELLLAKGADPNAPQQQGVTPLHGAASVGSAAAAGLLLLYGADINARMEDGKTPAEIARERGHPQLAERLAAFARAAPT
jgi:ankyrin repeat protein